ncbi:hypothetical protein Emag_001711 [Eimeria magna]
MTVTATTAASTAAIPTTYHQSKLQKQTAAGTAAAAKGVYLDGKLAERETPNKRRQADEIRHTEHHRVPAKKSFSKSLRRRTAGRRHTAKHEPPPKDHGVSQQRKRNLHICRGGGHDWVQQKNRSACMQKDRQRVDSSSTQPTRTIQLQQPGHQRVSQHQQAPQQQTTSQQQQQNSSSRRAAASATASSGGVGTYPSRYPPAQCRQSRRAAAPSRQHRWATRRLRYGRRESAASRQATP